MSKEKNQGATKSPREQRTAVAMETANQNGTKKIKNGSHVLKDLQALRASCPIHQSKRSPRQSYFNIRTHSKEEKKTDSEKKEH